jgi:hypothetical protein
VVSDSSSTGHQLYLGIFNGVQNKQNKKSEVNPCGGRGSSDTEERGESIPSVQKS